jgi:uncharacterized protein
MQRARLQLVVDTNTLLRALANPASASGKVVLACEERRAVILLSKPVLDEYRRVLSLDAIRARHQAITSRDVDLVIRRLRYFGDYHSAVGARFQYVRDPTDSMLIALAIDGNATHIISHDQDLLSLPRSRTEAGKRFRQRLPQTQVVRAFALMREHPWLEEA